MVHLFLMETVPHELIIILSLVVTFQLARSSLLIFVTLALFF